MGWELEELEEVAYLVAAGGSTDTESSSDEEEVSSSCSDEVEGDSGSEEASESSDTSETTGEGGGGRRLVCTRSESEGVVEGVPSSLDDDTVKEQSTQTHQLCCYHSTCTRMGENVSITPASGSGVEDCEKPFSKSCDASSLTSERPASRTEAVPNPTNDEDGVERLSESLQELLVLGPHKNQQTTGCTLIQELS